MRDVELSLRGLLRGFGLKVGEISKRAIRDAGPVPGRRALDAGADSGGDAAGPRSGAQILLTRAVRFSALKRWALEVARRRGMKRAKVALPRKLA